MSFAEFRENQNNSTLTSKKLTESEEFGKDSFANKKPSEMPKRDYESRF